MATIDLTDFVNDGQRLHGPEVLNDRLASYGCGIDHTNAILQVTISGSDRNITVPAMPNLVVPDGSGSFKQVDHAGGTAVVTTNGSNALPRTDILYVTDVGALTVGLGTPTAETGTRKEAPMIALPTNAILLGKIRMPGNATSVGTNMFWGRLKRTDVYRWRSIDGWLADDAQNPTLGNLPANVFADIPIIDVIEAFDSDGVDNISVGWDADTDALAKATDVSAVGVTNPLAGDEHGFIGTLQSVEGYYVNGGSAPTTGKAMVSVPYRFVPKEAA